MKSNHRIQQDHSDELVPITRKSSLNEAVNKTFHEMDTFSDHDYRYEDVTTTQRDAELKEPTMIQSNSNVTNIAVELLTKLDGSSESSCSKAMASYNDSNRIPDHATRWNSR